MVDNIIVESMFIITSLYKAKFPFNHDGLACSTCLGYITNSQTLRLYWHSCSVWHKLGWLNWFCQFFCKWLSSFNPKRFYYSHAWSFSLYERPTSFCMGLISRKLCRFLLTFPTSFTSISVLLLFPLLVTFFAVLHGF